MDSVVALYKKAGETPLMCLQRWQDRHPEFKHLPATYAGRLDPLAEGVLIVLYGEAVQQKTSYLSQEKEYEVEVLFGFSSDTGDVLGIPRTSQIKSFSTELELKQLLLNTIPGYIGAKTQAYPAYSSKTVQGKPLHWWARENRIDDISIPSREIVIQKIDILSYQSYAASELLSRIEQKISLVRGDFRQDTILSAWRTLLENAHGTQFLTATLSVTSSAGAYMRSLAENIGREVCGDGLALSILRTRVGLYTIAQTEK